MFKWPKDGLFLIRAENGKYWAETIAPDLDSAMRLQQMEAKGQNDTILTPYTDTQIFNNYLRPALESLSEQVSASRKKSLQEICKKQVARKLLLTH